MEMGAFPVPMLANGWNMTISFIIGLRLRSFYLGYWQTYKLDNSICANLIEKMQSYDVSHILYGNGQSIDYLALYA